VCDLNMVCSCIGPQSQKIDLSIWPIWAEWFQLYLIWLSDRCYH